MVQTAVFGSATIPDGTFTGTFKPSSGFTTTSSYSIVLYDKINNTFVDAGDIMVYGDQSLNISTLIARDIYILQPMQVIV